MDSVQVTNDVFCNTPEVLKLWSAEPWVFPRRVSEISKHISF